MTFSPENDRAVIDGATTSLHFGQQKLYLRYINVIDMILFDHGQLRNRRVSFAADSRAKGTT